MIYIMCEGEYVAAVFKCVSEVLGISSATISISCETDEDGTLYELAFATSVDAFDRRVDALCDELWGTTGEERAECDALYGMPGISGSQKNMVRRLFRGRTTKTSKAR
jgi:hypothetical protein